MLKQHVELAEIQETLLPNKAKVSLFNSAQSLIVDHFEESMYFVGVAKGCGLKFANVKFFSESAPAPGRIAMLELDRTIGFL